MLRLIFVFALLVVPGSASFAAADVTYKRNRFGILASDVWRYNSTFEAKDLTPVANNNPYPEPEIHRDRPTNITMSADGKKFYVTLQGLEGKPGKQVSVVDVATQKEIKRIEVGSRPYAGYLHPDGRYMIVTNEFSNYASVIDTTSDEVCGNIPLDYYGLGMAFAKDGKTAYAAIRYLNQVLVIDVETSANCLTGKVREIGGFSEAEFYGIPDMNGSLAVTLGERGYSDGAIEEAVAEGAGGINGILRGRCRACHQNPAGGFVSGDDKIQNFLSAVENAIGGNSLNSNLFRAVAPMAVGGYGDETKTVEFHPGGKLFDDNDPELKRLADWIDNGSDGPGIAVGNGRSHPKDLVLSSDGRYLFVGNTGTMDIGVIDTKVNREVGAIYTQNVTNHLSIYNDGKKDLLLIVSPGAGFGAPKERDPYGGGTWDPDNPAVQRTILRDPKTTDPYPLDQQHVMGPYDAIDGTWNFKMRDIQNDVIAVDVSSLDIPEWKAGMKLNYLLRVNKYESHSNWVRYTSDTAEATTGDIKGDIPPELQRVQGAFPSWTQVVGDRLFITMTGTFEVVEWIIQADAEDPSERLVPVKVYKTGIRPIGLTVGTTGPAKGKIFASNRMGETVSMIDRETGASSEIVVGDLTLPALDSDAEKGEFVISTTVLSSDGDVSCRHCHIRNTGDGRAWGAAESIGQNKDGDFTHGGTLGIPAIRNIYAIQPFYFEGTHMLGEGQGADVNEPASSIDFDRPVWTGDYTKISSPVPPEERRVMHEEFKERVSVHKLGDVWYELEERRAEFLREQTAKYFDAPSNLTDLYRYVGTYMGNDTHLMPNPFDQESPSVKRGQALFNSPQVMCNVCHTQPEFTNKTALLADNDRRALPQLITVTRRDASYSLAGLRAVDVANGITHDLDPDDKGRMEEEEGTFTTMQLRGIFDRPPVFLHHARARSLREVLLTPEHPAAREFRYPVLQGDEIVREGRMEIGFNETTKRLPSGELNPQDVIMDTHGGTSHLTVKQIDDLLHFLEAIE